LVLVRKARPNIRRLFSARAAYACGAAIVLLLTGSRVLQNAVAEGDTRSITLHHMHTGEDITITFKRDGRYDEAALEKLNWFLRDWRKQQETKMDPHLIDLVWEVQRETASNQPIWVVCGYRSPETNAMLRRRSNGVAKFSQHMLGHALDFYIPGVPLEQLRVIGLRLQRGGVGFYPTSGSPFVHIDTGGVRMWPRMTREQLVRVFPDQRTAYLPTDGRPLAGYDLAVADIKQRGGEVSTAVADEGESGSVNPITKLLHLARGDSAEEADGAAAAAPAPAPPQPAEPLRARAKAAVAAAVDRAEDKLAAEKAKLAAAAAKASEKLAAEKTKIAQAAAKVHVISRAEAAPLATTPNQIIVARGFWQGVPDGGAVAPQAATSAIAAVARPSRSMTASAAGDATGSVALAYADQTDGSGQIGDQDAALRAALLRVASVRSGLSATSVAVKRPDGATASTIFTVPTKRLNTTLADASRLADPWLRAIVVSPSVSRSLNITALGARDFRSLADFMAKPASMVVMSFGAEANPGLDAGHFSGSAVVFLSTVTYALRTAQLQ
jgi:uncharacterized protein YcbK (DUF882 family)